MWFSDAGEKAIGRVGANGIVTAFTLSIWSGGAGITPGPDGNIWFIEGGGARIGLLTPDG